MPGKLFNPVSFNPLELSEENTMNRSLLYGVSGCYFTEDGTDGETNLKLQEFQEGTVFPEFTRQYQHTLKRLIEECKKYSVLITVLNEKDEAVIAFELFQKRLFDSQDYYSTRKAELFGSGKKVLEDILWLLNKDMIPLDVKKMNLLNLQKELIVCADGALGKIIDAHDNLQAAYYGVPYLKTNILRSLIQQLAVETLRITHVETQHYIDNETHYVTAYCNYVARSYGLPEKQDQMTKSLAISEEELQQFALDVDKAITPEAFLKAVCHSLTDELILMRARFFDRFFKKHQKIPLEQYKNLVDEGTNLIEIWNKRYNDLLPLDLNILFQLNDQGTHIIPSPYHEATIKQVLSRNFNKLYLSPGNYERSYKLSRHGNLVINNGLSWIERDNEVVSLDSKGIVKKQNRLGNDCVILYALINCFPEKAHKLLKHHEDKKLHLNPAQLLRYGFYRTLKAALTDEKLTARYLIKNELQTAEFAHAANAFLTYPERDTLIRLLFRKGWICSETITILWPTIISTHPEQLPGVLGQLLEMNLLTSELVRHTIPAYESNIALFLTRLQKFSLLSELLHKELLSKDCLQDSVEDQNVAWILVKRKQFILFRDLLNKNLLTIEMLRVKPKQEQNIIWILINAHQTQLVASLVHANLLNTELLLEPDSSNNHALQLLFKNGHYDLLVLMLQKGVVTKELLAEKLEPITLVWKSISELINKEYYELIEVLLDKNRLSWTLSTSPGPGFLHPKKSTLAEDVAFLKSRGQIRLVEQLIQKGIINTSLIDGELAIGISPASLLQM